MDALYLSLSVPFPARSFTLAPIIMQYKYLLEALSLLIAPHLLPSPLRIPLPPPLPPAIRPSISAYVQPLSASPSKTSAHTGSTCECHTLGLQSHPLSHVSYCTCSVALYVLQRMCGGSEEKLIIIRVKRNHGGNATSRLMCCIGCVRGFWRKEAHDVFKRQKTLT
ncbi:hypothetical protein WMY93_025939 [Mugilogobius chulae]|uniref:Uncharacterized protein n=1 Tax=Mugilogobius chulae TaxID=88201 RepID=A0AAW0N5Y9_9GOBI